MSEFVDNINKKLAAFQERITTFFKNIDQQETIAVIAIGLGLILLIIGIILL